MRKNVKKFPDNTMWRFLRLRSLSLSEDGVMGLDDLVKWWNMWTATMFKASTSFSPLGETGEG